MVTFVSQCEKKALNRTRRVLDAFANRIGDNTWQTVITQEGLKAVRKLLRKTASKSTAVSCHWIRSRSRSELVWVVGNKQKFDEQGMVPVNRTMTSNNYRDDSHDWHYLPHIQALASLAALFHDWGKATARFQEKLDKKYKGKAGDALRHEWISCLLLKALIAGLDSDGDSAWLSLLADGEIDESELLKIDLSEIKPLIDLPPIARLIAWLILTHHRMPLPQIKNRDLPNEFDGRTSQSIEELFAYIDENWSYSNKSASETRDKCFKFPNGLLSNSKQWIKPIRRWSKKLLEKQSDFEKIFKDGSYRVILHHARLCLMLGDHYYSSLSLENSGKWNKTTDLIANTQKNGSPKQALDQHLVGVYQQAKRNVQKLPQLEQELPVTDNIAALKKRSQGQFSWQEKAAKSIQEWTKNSRGRKHGFFAVNMASTGCGKTFANAKVMLALSENNDSLRYILALGLRTLTLQTGDEYRERIFQNSDGSDLAVLIGSKAIADLHNQENEIVAEEQNTKEKGSESQESLIEDDDEVFYDIDISEDGLATILPKLKDRKFLYAPILSCTIDHIMAATETTRGGRYILPSIRLMSSDLVIDEVDDFTGSDAIAIGRLIHLAGMLGRKVMISSATIPPALAEGYFNCYQEGWKLFSQTRDAVRNIGCAWIDEFNTEVVNISNTDAQQSILEYSNSHNSFIEKRVAKLSKQPAKRKANIINCREIISKQNTDDISKQTAYFDTIFESILVKHQLHQQTDARTSLNVSFGVVRVANISPCVAVTRYLLSIKCPENTEIRVMSYHSQQVLLLRHEQEKHLDTILKRKELPGEEPLAFQNGVIRKHLDSIKSTHKRVINTIFILVATPVEEVGRDHDFDWAIVEPSSYRSIVQLAGRVRRHRSGAVDNTNVGLLQYNWKAIRSGDKEYACYFTHPGYELSQKIIVNGRERKASCKVHDLQQLVNENLIAQRLDAIPRISEKASNGFGLAKLEHAVTAHWLTRYSAKGPETLQGYLNQHWYLTALPQAMNRFRQSQPSISLFRCFSSFGQGYFTVKDEKGMAVYAAGELANQNDEYRIKELDLTEEQMERLWLYRDYRTLLAIQADKNDMSLNYAALRYGELVIQEPSEGQIQPEYLYSDQLGLFKE